MAETHNNIDDSVNYDEQTLAALPPIEIPVAEEPTPEEFSRGAFPRSKHAIRSLTYLLCRFLHQAVIACCSAAMIWRGSTVVQHMMDSISRRPMRPVALSSMQIGD